MRNDVVKLYIDISNKIKYSKKTKNNLFKLMYYNTIICIIWFLAIIEFCFYFSVLLITAIFPFILTTWYENLIWLNLYFIHIIAFIIIKSIINRYY